jgi:hypothetical protein
LSGASLFCCRKGETAVRCFPNVKRADARGRAPIVKVIPARTNEGILDYFALPSSKIAGPKLSLFEKNRARLDSQRGSIDALSNKISALGANLMR